jgi:hypothetical protein
VRDLQYKGDGLEGSENTPPAPPNETADKVRSLLPYVGGPAKKPGLLARLKQRITKPKGEVADHHYAVPVDEDVKVNSSIEVGPMKGVEDLTPSRPGGIRKAKAPSWNPDQTRHGGRVVRHMPRDLQKMKEKQEGKTGDDAE